MSAVIEVRDLVKTYDGTTAVDGVSFDVEEDEIFAIVGPNGAGKTTTVESIEGLRQPDSGTIRVLGLDPRRDAVEVHKRLGSQLQATRLHEKLKVWEAIDLFASFYDQPASWEQLLVELGLEEKRNTRIGNLSGGQHQRLSIALALVGRPEVAILDELTTGLDPNARRATWELIESVRDRGVTIVLVTHFMEEAERLADRVAIIDRGRVVAIDTPSALVTGSEPEFRIHFRPGADFDPAFLTDLPEVAAIDRQGSRLTVEGDTTVLHAVTSALARRQIVVADLRIEQSTLDDVFVTLTGRTDTAETAPES